MCAALQHGKSTLLAQPPLANFCPTCESPGMTETASKLALITGASRGLGAALAEALAPDYHIVAVARKLSVVLHHLWRTGSVYEPLHHAALHNAA